MNVVCMTLPDCRLMAARFAEHGNSHHRMRAALLEADAADAVARLDALRRVERTFDLDLGSVCHRFQRRRDPAMHPIERRVVEYITELRPAPGGGHHLWILLERVQQVRELMEGRLVGEPER